MGVIYYTRDAAVLTELVRVCAPRFTIVSGCDSVAVPAFMSGVPSSTGALAVLMPEVIDAAWQSMHEPNLPFAWRAQTDLLRAHEVMAPWAICDIGCAVLARLGVNMAGRSRAARTYPERNDVERVTREISVLRAAYLG
jgi:dihydrodipicolinate synthase/N-acetylneuraminate lyase